MRQLIATCCDVNSSHSVTELLSCLSSTCDAVFMFFTVSNYCTSSLYNYFASDLSIMKSFVHARCWANYSALAECVYSGGLEAASWSRHFSLSCAMR